MTLALAYDIDAISKAGLIQANWRSRLPHNSTPYTSTIIFVVRKGNPKNIHGWDDLVKPGVSVVVPNPKTSGGARWAYLAGYGWALRKYHSDSAARDYISRFYHNVPVLDSGARGSTTTFTQRGIGDVLVAWENEALLTVNQLGKGQFQIVVPSESILAEPPVSIVDKVVDKHNTRALATAYLNFLYYPLPQQIAAKHYYRPWDAKYASQFAKLKLFTIDEVFGGWTKAQATHFADGGVFDQIYHAGK